MEAIRRATKGARRVKDIVVCMGKSCGFLGGVEILEEVTRKTGVMAGQTNEHYSLKTSGCLGYCSYAPNMEVNKKQHKAVDPAHVAPIIHDDNPNDHLVGTGQKTDPNANLGAEEILDANNFLGDLS